MRPLSGLRSQHLFDAARLSDWQSNSPVHFALRNWQDICCRRQYALRRTFGCAALVQWIANMRQPFRTEHPSSSLEALQTRRLIADIGRIIEILNCDIADEEARAGVSDPSRPEYPILARALAARRENLQSTM